MDAERYDFFISYYTPKGDKENIILSFKNENPMVSFKQDLQLLANGKSAVRPELETANMKDSFLRILLILILRWVFKSGLH